MLRDLALLDIDDYRMCGAAMARGSSPAGRRRRGGRWTRQPEWLGAAAAAVEVSGRRG
jgi:hypothetical protein